MNKISDIMLKLTDRCNLECSYCYMNEKNHTEINPLTALNIIKSISTISQINYGRPMNVYISGGEATLLPVELLDWFFSVLRTIPNINISMNTNGTLFTVEHAQMCKKYTIDISLSLDGNKEIHNRHRSDSFNDVMTTIAYLESEKIKYGLITVIDKKSCDKKEDLYEFFKQNKLNTKMNNANGFSSHDDYTDFLIWLSKKLKKDNYPFREYTIFDIEKTMNGISSHCEGCAWGDCYRDFIAIDFDGNVSICERFFGLDINKKKDYILGNVNNKSIINILHSEIYNNLQKILFTQKLECTSCEYYKYCGGGCIYDKIISGDAKQMCESRKRLFSELSGG